MLFLTFFLEEEWSIIFPEMLCSIIPKHSTRSARIAWLRSLSSVWKTRIGNMPPKWNCSKSLFSFMTHIYKFWLTGISLALLTLSFSWALSKLWSTNSFRMSRFWWWCSSVPSSPSKVENFDFCLRKISRFLAPLSLLSSSPTRYSH